MKSRSMQFSSMALAATLLTCPAIFAQEADTNEPVKAAQVAYLEAINHEKAGNATAAKASYEIALKLNPQHANARYRLGQLKNNYDRVVSKGKERQFSSVVIPEIDFHEADFSEALEALTILVEKASNNEVTSNFIIRDHEKVLKDRKVTLKMKNVPSGAAFKHLLQQARAKAEFEEHAVVIKPYSNSGHVSARSHHGQDTINYGGFASKFKARKFSSVVIPKIEFHEAEFSEALDALTTLVERESNNEVTTNFVIQDPEKALTDRKVTLKMKNVPSGAAFKHLLQQARAKAEFEEHAVVIRPY